MAQIADTEHYLKALLAAPRYGLEGIYAFYDYRVDAIATDARLMLLPWDDHLVHRGDGIFETMKFIGGKLYQLDSHLERLQRSSTAIHLMPPCTWEKIRELTLEVAKAAGKDKGLIRIMLGRGAGGFGLDPAECPQPSLYIVAYAIHPRPESAYEKGVTAFKTSVPAKQPYLATIKSIDYLPNVLMKREAREKGYDFPFCFDDKGFLAEGATENVCIVDQDDKLHIPEFTNALAGTTLMRAVDLIKDEMPIIFRGISEDEVKEAKEVIICGTTIDALSVVRYEGWPIFNVRPGPVSRRMRELIRADIAENGVEIG